MNFGHLEALHSKFHDPTISNLGDQSGQTNRQTDKQTNKQIVQLKVMLLVLPYFHLTDDLCASWFVDAMYHDGKCYKFITDLDRSRTPEEAIVSSV